MKVGGVVLWLICFGRWLLNLSSLCWLCCALILNCPMQYLVSSSNYYKTSHTFLRGRGSSEAEVREARRGTSQSQNWRKWVCPKKWDTYAVSCRKSRPPSKEQRKKQGGLLAWSTDRGFYLLIYTYHHWRINAVNDTTTTTSNYIIAFRNVTELMSSLKCQ